MRYRICFIRARRFPDFFTLEERFGNLRGLKLAYVGDGNNMCHSLLSIAGRVGAHLRVATPEGFEPNADVVSEAKRMARETRGKIEILRSPEEAVAGAQAIYTDVWTSMGQEEESEVREKAFTGYQVNEALFSAGGGGCDFHALPSGTPRVGSQRRNYGFAAIDRIRASGEPAARAEGNPAHFAQLIPNTRQFDKEN